MKSLACVLVVVLGSSACTRRTTNLQVRYAGVVGIVAAGLTIVEPSLNGDGFDPKLVGIGAAIGTVGLALLVGSFLALPNVEQHEAQERAHEEAILKQRADNAAAVGMMNRAKAAARAGDCGSVLALDRQIAQLDPGVGSVLHADAAVARCFVEPTDPTWF